MPVGFGNLHVGGKKEERCGVLLGTTEKGGDGKETETHRTGSSGRSGRCERSSKGRERSQVIIFLRLANVRSWGFLPSAEQEPASCDTNVL